MWLLIHAFDKNVRDWSRYEERCWDDVGNILSWEETDRIKKTVWPYESVRAQMPVRESCFSEAHSWHKIKNKYKLARDVLSK